MPMTFVRKEWASRDSLLAEVADVPDGWLRGFAMRHRKDCRKFATARGGKMLYRVSAVLQALESGEAMPNEGIPQHQPPELPAVVTVAVPIREPKGVER